MRPRLALAALLLAVVSLPGTAHAGGGGCHEMAPTHPRDTDRIAMRNFCMSPGAVRVPVGATVTVVNEDEVLHNLYGANWYHGDLEPSASATHTFERAGTYAIACTLHPGMVGTVQVGESRLIAASTAGSTGGDGEPEPTATTVVAALALSIVGLATGWWLGRRRSLAEA